MAKTSSLERVVHLLRWFDGKPACGARVYQPQTDQPVTCAKCQRTKAWQRRRELAERRP